MIPSSFRNQWYNYRTVFWILDYLTFSHYNSSFLFWYTKDNIDNNRRKQDSASKENK